MTKNRLAGFIVSLGVFDQSKLASTQILFKTYSFLDTRARFLRLKFCNSILCSFSFASRRDPYPNKR